VIGIRVAALLLLPVLYYLLFLLLYGLLQSKQHGRRNNPAAVS
jgi:hypothetical protein